MLQYTQAAAPKLLTADLHVLRVITQQRGDRQVGYSGELQREASHLKGLQLILRLIAIIAICMHQYYVSY
jgi:hypothetical protein